jgi:arabinogalactan oligomer/maltooligosaccharide transport system substrate-binding protein
MRGIFFGFFFTLWIQLAAHAAPLRDASDSPVPGTIVFWHNLNLSQAAILKDILKKFSLSTGVPVHVETGMSLTRALVKQHRRGALPDVILAASDFVSIASEVPLGAVPSDWIPTWVQKRFVNELFIEGKLLGVPFLSGNHLMLYSNSLLVPKPAETWEGIEAQVPELAAKGVSAVAMDVREPYFFLPFMLHAGAFSAGVLSPDLREDWPRLSDALRTYGGLVSRGVIPSFCSYLCSTRDFIAGKFAYAISGDWFFPEASAAFGDHLGVSQLPSLAGKQMRSISSSQALFFPGSTAKGARRESLRKLTRYLLDEKLQLRFALEMGRMPVTQGALAALSKQDLSPAQANLVKVFQTSQPLRSTLDTSYTWLLLRKALSFHFEKTAPPDEIVRFLREKTVNKISSYERSKP